MKALILRRTPSELMHSKVCKIDFVVQKFIQHENAQFSFMNETYVNLKEFSLGKTGKELSRNLELYSDGL